MAVFRYKAYTTAGKTISGIIDADSTALAKERLQRQGVLISQLSLEKQRGEIALSASLLLSFTRELSQLLSAGLPLYESLLTIEEKYRNHKAHSLFLNFCDCLKNGGQLSSALKKYPKTFDTIYLTLVQAGEQTGTLAWIFEQLTQLITRQQRLRKQLISAMAYPSFLGGFCLLVISSLLFFIVPSMKELFEGRALHPLTQTVLGLSCFLKENGIYVLLFLGSLIAGFIALKRTERGKYFLHRLLVSIPLLKTILLESALVRFCRSTSLLLSGGVPLINALTLSKKVMKHIPLEEIISGATKGIVEGKRLSELLSQNKIVPPLVTRMLALSEETGQMASIFLKIADIYEQELEKNLTRLTALLQPALLLILGGIVGLVILSILIPLTDVSSFISN